MDVYRYLYRESNWLNLDLSDKKSNLSTLQELNTDKAPRIFLVWLQPRNILIFREYEFLIWRWVRYRWHTLQVVYEWSCELLRLQGSNLATTIYVKKIPVTWLICKMKSNYNLNWDLWDKHTSAWCTERCCNLHNPWLSDTMNLRK